MTRENLPELSDQKPTRRDVLLQAAVLGATASFASGQQSASPPSDTHSQNTSSKPPTDPGPENPGLLKENPSSWTPPPTDSGDVNNFRYPFAFGHNRVSADAGWARQVT